MKTTAPFEFETEKSGLSDKQELFCMEYIRCKFNGYQAAIKAGYSKSTALDQLARLMKNAKIQSRIKELKKDIGLMIGVDAVKIGQEYANIGFFDIGKIFTKEGTLKPLSKIDKASRAAIAGIEMFEVTGPEGVLIGVVKKIKSVNKIAALDNLAKMIGVDGVTKIAQTDTQGNDTPPLSDSQVDKILNAIKNS